MADVTDVGVNLGLGRAGLESVTARAPNGRGRVLRMNIGLHECLEINGDVERNNLTKRSRKRQGDKGLPV
jgi:hypothetical protein